MYTVAHKLCAHYDYIGIGDYTPKGEGLFTAMRRSMNNRSLIGQFNVYPGQLQNLEKQSLYIRSKEQLVHVMHVIM